MNKFNFNSIDNLEIPDYWAEKAIENSKKPRVVYAAKTTKILAFVASLVLVCGISVAVFFITNENAIPTVAETKPTEIPAYVESSKNQSLDGVSESEIKTENPTDTIEDNTQTIEPAEQSTTSSTVTPTQNKKPISNSTKPNSTQKPNVPQQTDSGGANNPQDPIEQPTVPALIEPSDSPTDPVPTEKGDMGNVSVSVSIYKHLVLEDKKIYCKVYDENGVLLGDPDAFSDEHLTELTFYSYYTAYYYPYRYSLISKSGDYTFVFYNSNGEVAREVTKYLEYFEP